MSQRSQEMKRECFLGVNKILTSHLPFTQYPFFDGCRWSECPLCFKRLKNAVPKKLLEFLLIKNFFWKKFSEQDFSHKKNFSSFKKKIQTEKFLEEISKEKISLLDFENFRIFPSAEKTLFFIS